MKPLVGLVVAMLFSPISAYCREVKFSKSLDMAKLESDLRAAGFNVKHTTCSGINCSLILADSETKDPSAIIAAMPPASDMVELGRAAREQAIALAKKLKAGTATPAEKDVLLLRLCYLLLSSDQ